MGSLPACDDDMAAQSRLWAHKLDADTTVLVVMASWRDFALARTAEPVPMIQRHPDDLHWAQWMGAATGKG